MPLIKSASKKAVGENIKQEKADIREAKKGYPAPKQPKKKGK